MQENQLELSEKKNKISQTKPVGGLKGRSDTFEERISERLKKQHRQAKGSVYYVSTWGSVLLVPP